MSSANDWLTIAPESGPLAHFSKAFMMQSSAVLSAEQETALPQNWSDIEAELSRFHESFPQLALEAALRQPGISVKPFLAELTACAAEPAKRANDDEGWMLHLYAMHLLAALRETQAFAPMMQLLRLEGETLEDLLGDHLTEGAPRALAATCPQDEAALQALAADRTAYFWSRSAALRALTLRSLEGDYPREKLLAWLEAEGTREAERMMDEGLQPEQGTHTDYLCELVVSMEEIGAHELTAQIAQWFEDGLIDDAFLSFEESKTRLTRSWQACIAEELDHGWGYPRDIIGEIGRWACFHDDEDDEETERESQAPIKREAPKVGRNDPCPCGSGKKYKKCCGANA
ncbi:hypothetical protein CSQ89_15505 [Chitinimonas sp. BJB300]|nr:hypothetical protein CSQ89_15505 [Chitinimonas sp. BJB300]